MGGGGSKDGINQMVDSDWKKIEKNGQVYYLNIHTNERRAFLIEEMPETAQNDTAWTELFDENTGNPYYWNSETNETTWEIPPELDEIYKIEETFYLKQLYKNAKELSLKTKEHVNGWQEIYQSKEAALKSGSQEPICFYYNKISDTLQYGTPVDVVRNQQKLRSEELQSTWDGEQLLAKMKELNNEINEEMATLNDRVKTERARQRMKLQEMRNRKRAGKNLNRDQDGNEIEAPAANTAETILRDLKDRRSKYKVGLKTHIEEQDEVYNKDAEWQMWEEIVDTITGKPYYHNVATGKTQWTMPHGLALAYEGQEQELLRDFVNTPGFIVQDVEGTGDKTWEMIYDPKAEKDFIVYRNKNTKELTAERPESLIDTELKAKEAKLDQAKKMLNETWDGKRLQKELSKLRNAHEDELVEYASTVQDERKRQREKMREKLRERQRRKANSKKHGGAGIDNDNVNKPPPPRTKDAYLDATTTDDLKKGNDSFASLLAM